VTADTLRELLIIAALIALNAVFVAAEIALVTVRRTRLDQLVREGSRSARRARTLVADPGRFLAVIQLGITFIGFLASAYAAVSLTLTLERTFDANELLAPYSEALALIIVTAILSIITIIFGELVPKSFALRHTERFALLLAGPVDILGRVLAPVVWFLTKATSLITRGAGGTMDGDTVLGSEELRLLVEQSRDRGLIEAEESQMIGAIFDLGGRRVHEVMVPRTDIVAVQADTSVREALHVMVGSGRSRLPLYEETLDNIVGLLHAQDLLRVLAEGDEPDSIRPLVREAVFVPRSEPIDDVLHELQRQQIQMAVVLDEYGGTAGLVTVEDVLEEIVGEIRDEFDREKPMVVRLDDGRVRLDGRASADKLERLFGPLPGLDSADYDTVSGLVYHTLGRVPEPGDTVAVDDLVLTVETLVRRRVGSVLAEQLPPPDASP
jgi:Hemolysins and related proteins containing CBS domains